MVRPAADVAGAVILERVAKKWTQQNIGFALTAGGFAGLLSQLPSGELPDAIRSKRVVVALGATMVAASALMIALRPSFPLVCWP
jgi:predicted MFS family arabinose efflux permease